MTTQEKIKVKNYLSSSFPASEWADRGIEEARRWINVPFRHAGRDVFGIDCVGLPIKILHFLGLTNWDDIAYSRSVNPDRMKSEIELFCSKIEGGLEHVQKLDLLWFNVMGSAQHVGVYAGTETNTIIHAYESAGKVVEHEFTDKWRKRVQTVFRLTGME